MSFTQSRHLNDAQHRLGTSLVEMAWFFNELTYEAEGFRADVVEYRWGALDYASVQMQYDVLWSRLDIIRHLDLAAQPNLRQLLTEFDQMMLVQDPIIFAAEPVEFTQLDALRNEVGARIVDLRRTWIADFNASQFDALTPAARDLSIQRQKFDLASYVVISAVFLYLLAEVFFASRGQATEQRLTKEAEAASQAKSDFIASVSHEIRTPLNGILGMADALQASALSDEQSHYVDVLSESGGVLLATINDVLEFSRIEAGNIDLLEKPFDLRKTLMMVHTLYQEKASSKDLAFELRNDDSLPAVVVGDQRRLRQVLHNLVANAIKFTEEGRVVLHSRYVGPEDTEGALAGLYVSVSDTGPGIDRAEHTRIFEPFGQADSSVTRKHGGTGLGLSISRDICLVMGGDLTVQSAIGQGAIFEVFVPFTIAEMPAAKNSVGADGAEPSVQEWSGLRVMIVDDSATNRFVLRKILRDCPITIAEADSGQAALDQMVNFAPHLVLMDIQMPQMDGTETVRRITAMAESGLCDMPRVTAVTANVMPDQIEAYLTAGMDEVLCKPINRKRLFAAVDCVSRDVRVREPEASRTSVASA